MNVTIKDSTVHVTLSERNLKTLLSKIQREGSANTLYSTMETGIMLIVQAQTDAAHYGERTPGAVHPLDEPRGE